MLQFRKVLSLLGREASCRLGSFSHSLVCWGLVWSLTPGSSPQGGALNFRCSIYPTLPSSALVHLPFLPLALPSRGSVVSHLRGSYRLVFCVMWMLNSCQLNVHCAHVLGYTLCNYNWSPDGQWYLSNAAL